MKREPEIEKLLLQDTLCLHPAGLIVVDTGETVRVAEPGYFPWWHPYFKLGVRAWVRPEKVDPFIRARLLP